MPSEPFRGSTCLCHHFLCDVGEEGAVRSLWPFPETKFVCATLPSCQIRKLSYVDTHEDILRSLSSVWGLVLWADPCILLSALRAEDAAESHVMNTSISCSWLGCVKFCHGSQGSSSLCGEQRPTFKQTKLYLFFLRFFRKFRSACCCWKSLSLERGRGSSDQEWSEQTKSGKIFAWWRRESQAWGLGKGGLAEKAYLQAF